MIQFVVLFADADFVNIYNRNKANFDSLKSKVLRNSESYFCYISNNGYIHDEMVTADSCNIANTFYNLFKKYQIDNSEQIEKQYSLLQMLDKKKGYLSIVIR